MTDDFSQDPIEGDDARKIRKMHHEWEEFRKTDLEPMKKISWIVRNWKLFALAAIIGAAGSLKNVLETAKAWLG